MKNNIIIGIAVSVFALATMPSCKQRHPDTVLGAPPGAACSRIQYGTAVCVKDNQAFMCVATSSDSIVCGAAACLRPEVAR